MAINKDIDNLVINRVESQEVFNYMLSKNLINDDEFYLVQEEVRKELPDVTTDNNGDFLRVVDGIWTATKVLNAEGKSF